MINRKLLFCCHNILRRNHSISHILKHGKVTGDQFNVKAWVRSHRAMKEVTFLSVNDGSCVKDLQIVVPAECLQIPVAATYGTSVHVTGILKESQGRAQELDFLADKVQVLGRCDAKDFAFKSKKRHPPDYIRQFLHLRPKTKSFSSMLRIRNQLTQAIHQTLQEEGFLQVDTPILTSNDCEGGGEVFSVKPAADHSVFCELDRSEGLGQHDKFFGADTFLTVSGQLHLEAVAGAFSRVYTLGPTFRAENSRGRHHLAEFYMLEAELAFTDDLNTLLEHMERMVHEFVRRLLETSGDDLHWHWQQTPDPKAQQNLVETLAAKSFERISYTEAIDILSPNQDQFEFTPKWGSDLQKDHERYLVRHHGNVPVFVTDFPAKLKPFYMRRSPDQTTVSAVDLLVPDVGELCGGSLRETCPDQLRERIQHMGAADSLDWYLDLRRFGVTPTAGFGLGLERLLMVATGTRNIRDVIPFPRSPGNCRL